MTKPNFLSEWRKHRGLSQEALAAKATDVAQEFELPREKTELPSWGRTDVNKYEKGAREPPLSFMRAASIVLGCRVDDLIGRPPSDPAPDPDDLRDVGPVWRNVEDAERPRALDVLRQFATRK